MAAPWPTGSILITVMVNSAGAPTHGYGAKTLAHKLGLTQRPDWRVLSIDAPQEYPELLADVWPLASYTAVSGRAAPQGLHDLVHLFALDEAHLVRRLPAALDCLDDGAALWLSWPKKSSPLFRDLTEDGLRRHVLPTGWVDVKVAAVSEIWSGLKFLRRRG